MDRNLLFGPLIATVRIDGTKTAFSQKKASPHVLRVEHLSRGRDRSATDTDRSATNTDRSATDNQWTEIRSATDNYWTKICSSVHQFPRDTLTIARCAKIVCSQKKASPHVLRVDHLPRGRDRSATYTDRSATDNQWTGICCSVH